MPPSLQRFLDGLAESYADHQLEMVSRSFFLLERDAKRRRLHAIMALSAERQRLLDEHGRHPQQHNLPQGFQASAFMESTIGYLISGELDEVRAYADMYLFEGEDPQWAQRYIEIYAPFRAMAHAAIEDNVQ